MELSYIREFVTLAETQSFSETADRLFLSQSTISKHIKKIEDELNVELFVRSSRSVHLTLEGERFLQTARQITGIMDDYMTDLQNTRSNTLFVASVPMTPTEQITQLLVAFMKKYPEYKVSVTKGQRSENIDRLARGQSNISFSYNDVQVPDNMDQIPFFTDELCVVVPSDHPLAARDAIYVEHLRDEDLLLPETDSAFYNLCIQLCRQAGFVPNVKVQLHKAFSSAVVISSGLCIAMFPRSLVSGFSPSTAFKVLSLTPPVHIMTYILCPKNPPRSSVTGKFIKFAKEMMAMRESAAPNQPTVPSTEPIAK